MPKIILKIIPALIFWGIFTFVIFYVEYPTSLTQASGFQILAFFVPLFLALAFTTSFFIALGVIFLLLLKALNALNIVSAVLTITAVGLLFSYFRKSKTKYNLTSVSGISKLTSLHRKKQ
ncbi:TPA: hypothetical protein DEP06_04275 [Candidatus Daviesbacteria bacterium]|uniref:Uncharacterized protein n=1 Tax=Candidatus Daviesbacteria bacterium GW2011_GWF2_38_6 TaxID=1618432 RepID=A0A0G0KSX8_9BACT|nr:MAG: hypothetical protein US99_C0016G0014 [Candidatus Daviesbacteria bacterium GW2011_GWF2_38_6]OGE73479.1 MAG: hypothetical protein A3H18_03250 [Candidatus Daviesbacteria bacterium RIFCSPLOWO2_12_FULL_38_10]HCB23005.1 hypothetical protein [Candidatus Daviesbacteria bacterium]